MKSASNYAYIKKRDEKVTELKKQLLSRLQEKQRFADEREERPLVDPPVDLSDEEVDTNVISVDFANITDGLKNLCMGDAIFCKKCSASLSSLSTANVFPREKYIKHVDLKEQAKDISADPHEEEKDDKLSKKMIPEGDQKNFIPETEIKSHESVWICEFCSHHNKISIEAEELPKTDDIFFMLKSATQQLETTTTTTQDQDISVIFCIDFSGSMCVSSEIQVKDELRHGLSAEEYEMLKDFIEDNASQLLPNQKQDTQWISRKQCVLAAIESQLEEMKKTHPNRKVGVVAFNSEVIVYGDGGSDPIIVAGDKLNKEDVCLSVGIDNYEKLLSASIVDSSKRLMSKLSSLKENGKTALGPALAVSLGLASRGKPGSTVILCTDGLANVGIGELDSPSSDNDPFYERMGNYAKERGIQVNVITIKGEGCRMDRLGKIADVTQGQVTRVNPDSIAKDFSNIMKEEVVATKVKLRVRLHQSLKFRREEKENLAENDSLCERDVGNVTAKTILTFEYQSKNDVELAKEGIDIGKLSQLPIQAHVYYTSREGHQLLRVITMKLQTTQDLKCAQKGVDVRILATRATQLTSNNAGKGEVIMARKVNKKWDEYISNDLAMDNAASPTFQEGLADWQENNTGLKRAVNKNIKRAKQNQGFFGKLSSKFKFSNKEDEEEFEKETRCLSIAGSDDEDETKFIQNKAANFMKKK